MDISHIVENLNDAQRQAVTAPLSNLLVLAGAGSGKTRVLVHRIAWLIQVENLYPSSILAVTFTNKAAHEMRSRIETLLGISTQGMWVGTFHGLAHRLLRMHWQDAGLPENFQVIDSDDQYRLIRRIMKEMNLDENQWAPKQTQWFISGEKDKGIRPKDIKAGGDIYLKTMKQIYERYESACEQGGLVDFAELLLRAYELWRDNDSVRAHYQQRFKHILVDEFQDTNGIQYEWLTLLKTADNYMIAVGDDDQSIYGWRGAKIENLHRLLKDIPDTQTIRLEQNYRSTGNILNAANALIEKNTGRMGKNLWTSDSDGELIQVYQGFNELDEARYIVSVAKQWIDHGNNRKEIAVLYRSNAQSRVLEEAFIQMGIPYRVYGGLRFFERAEIKDALAYLRLINNHSDGAAFERIINTPTRGIGNTTVEALRLHARDFNISMWQATLDVIDQKLLSGRAINALQNFVDLITQLRDATKEFDLGLAAEHVIDVSGLINHFRKEKGEKGRARIENLQELVTAAKQFNNEDETMADMQAFLSHAALEAGESQGDKFEDCVQMMTLHSAKGLEFPLVFIAGVEEGLFPHQMSLEEPGRLQEERRLCYVGITRAMKKLYLTFADSRRLYGREVYHRPSRFIREIPKEYLNEVRLKTEISRPVISSNASASSSKLEFTNDSGFQVGDRVKHKKFGEGMVLAYEGSGQHARIHVNFKDTGNKWLIASFLECA